MKRPNREHRDLISILQRETGMQRWMLRIGLRVFNYDVEAFERAANYSPGEPDLEEQVMDKLIDRLEVLEARQGA